MKLQEQYPEIGEGWSSLLSRLNAMDRELKNSIFYKGIANISRENGMLKVSFILPEPNETTSIGIYDLTEAVAYRLERLSAKLCELCGQYGIRRTELPTVQTLCTKCYALKYSEMVENTSK